MKRRARWFAPLAMLAAACGNVVSPPGDVGAGADGGAGAGPVTGGFGDTVPGATPGASAERVPPKVDPEASAIKLWVAPGGRDDAACTKEAPCREIARALREAKPSTTIYVADGAYEGFHAERVLGEPGKPIIVLATGRNADVRPVGEQDTIFVDRCAHLVIDGLRSRGARRAAVRVSGSKFVTVMNGVFADNGRWGIFTDFSDDLLLERNDLSGSADEHGIYISNSGDRPIVRGNRVHGNNASGIPINADGETRDGSGIYDGDDDGLCTGALLENNVIWENGRGGGAAINLDGVVDSVVRNNLVYANSASGIVAYGDADGRPGDGLGGGDGFDGNGRRGPSGLVVVHNTVVMPVGSSRSALLVRYSFGSKKNVLKNNILLHPGGTSLELGGPADLALLESDHNVLDAVSYGDAELDVASWQRLHARDARSLSAPAARLFVNAGASDFRLAEGSPAIDRGVVVSGAVLDLAQQARSRGAAPDIGAFER